MRNIWFISDTHFNHKNILTFTNNEGKLTRPGFDSIEAHNEHMIDQWNANVKTGDKIYHLGDVLMSMNGKEIHTLLARLNGSKRLLVGNHDAEYTKSMASCFNKIGLWRIFKEQGFVCTHIPLMPSQFRHSVTVNVHGHIHHNLMEDTNTYINVCVERTNYRPIHMDEIVEKIRSMR